MSIVVPDPATTKWVPLSYGASIQTNVPSARAYTTAVQSIPTGAWTALVLDGERWDTDNIHDNVTNNTRLTCRTAGKYLVTFAAAFAPNAVGTRGFCFRVNNTTLQGVVLVQAVSVAGREHYGNANIVLDLIVGDFVECLVYQESGAALNTSISVGQDAEIIYLGPGLVGRGQQNLVGIYSARPAANTVPPGTTYFAADALGTWVSDGTQWYLTAQRPAFGAAGILNSAPWNTPYDGMEILLTDSFANPVFMWHFRYNVGSGSAYKWEFVGGTEYVGYSSANVNVPTVNTWTNIVASTILPPRGGEYTLKSSTQISHPTAGATAYTAFWAGSLPGGIIPPQMATGFPVAGGYSLINVIGPFKASLAAGVGIGIAAQNNVTGGNFSFVQWSMIPTRIG